jgi:hypothetical protein
MVFFLPRRLIVAKKRQETAAMQFSPCGLDQKRATATRSYEGIDFLNQIMGKDDMCSL